ncbi:MAG: hypothetical protein ACR2MM_02780 [Flavobacteriaceae bacterium]
MRKLWLISLVFLLFFSCKQNQNADLLAEDTELEFDAETLPQRFRVNNKSANVLQSWVEYNAFDAAFDAIYTAANNEDLILIIEDLIEKQQLWEKSTYPDSFDKAQIKSRQKVLKTYLLKVRSALHYRSEFVLATEEMINAYNALRRQFDVMMNSTLDPKLLSDD